MNTLPRLLGSTTDFSPFFRSTVGFDRFMRILEDDLPRTNTSYPPYNIEKRDEDSYRVSMAVAGFLMDDIDITVQDNLLTVTGSQARDTQEKETTYLHRGIAMRNFEQKFQLADYIEVENASMENGMLYIDLVREVPESKKPRKININYGETLFGKAKKLTKKTA